MAVVVAGGSVADEVEPRHDPLRVGTTTGVERLAHAVCTLRRPASPRAEELVFAEGDVCPLGGGECSYEGVLNVDDVEVTVRRVAVAAQASEFRSADGAIRVRVEYGVLTCAPGQAHCESVDGPAVLDIRKGDTELRLEVEADCGA